MAATLDPSISMLFVLTEEELVREASSSRHGLQATEDGNRLLVSVSFDKNQLQVDDETPPADLEEQLGCCSLTITSIFNDVFTASLDLDDVIALSQQPGLVYISALPWGKERMNRTRSEIGANVIDGQTIRNGAAPWDGQGVVVGVVDSGIDLRHPAFREYPGGPTRVEWYWDRTVAVRPGSPDVDEPVSHIGVVYSRAKINNHLLGPVAVPPVIAPETEDFNGHGSHVAGIAAGNAADLRGIAPGASIIMVKYRNNDILQIHELTNWIFTRAGGPCSINISLGVNAEAHDGTSDVERNLDASLRDPVTLTPRPGRFIAVATGNERQKRWNLDTFALPVGRPSTQVAWFSPIGNDNDDDLEFWYSGKDEIAVRVLAPFTTGNRISHWVDPDPAGCIERPSSGGFAPVAAGAAPSKRFNFANNIVIIIAQELNPHNNDRRITINIRAPATPAVIWGGNWLIEFQGRNTLPGSGRIKGNVRDTNNQVVTNSSFRPAHFFARKLIVPSNGELNVHVGVGRVMNPLDLPFIVEYAEQYELEARITAPRLNGSNPSEWVRHNNVHAAVPNTIAPGAAGPNGLPFTFPSANAGMDQVVAIDHDSVAGVRRISFQIQQRPAAPPPNSPPEEGVYTLKLRAVNMPMEVPAVLLTQMTADVADNFRFQNLHNMQISVPVYPLPGQISASRLLMPSDGFLFETNLSVTVPGGAGINVRVRIPPEFSSDPTGWTFTPWVAGNNVEVPSVGALPVNGVPAAGAPRAYRSGGRQVTITYPAPAVGSDAQVTIKIEDFNINPITPGTWLVEYQANGIIAPLDVACELQRATDNIDESEREDLLSQTLDVNDLYLSGRPDQELVLPFSVLANTLGRIDIELLYDLNTELSLSVKAPGEVLTYRVGLNNTILNAEGVVPAVGSNGVTGSLSSGTRIVIFTPAAAAFGTQRRALVSIQSPVALNVYHPAGEWLLIIRGQTVGAERRIRARLISQATPAHWIIHATEAEASEISSLSVPATAREVMAVANTLPGFAPSALASLSSSAGPVRTASEMRINGIQKPWLPYQKPEIAAPGHQILSVCAGANAIWYGEHLGWNSYTIRGGHFLGMRATWPFLNNGQRSQSQNIPPSAAAGTVTEVNFDVVIPNGASHQTSLELRYPAARNFAIRVTQPAAAPAPNLTSAVSPAGALVAIPAAAVATASLPHPDGAGQIFACNDGTRISIRQTGNGVAKIDMQRNQNDLQAGVWRITVHHTEVYPAPVAAVLEALPELDTDGWPSLAPDGNVVNPNAGYSASAPPRLLSNIGLAASAANPFSLNYFLHINSNCVPDVTVSFNYPIGAHNFEVLVLTPNAAQHTDGITTAGAINAIGGARPVNAAVANGANFRFSAANVNGNLATITQNAGNAVVTLSRGTSADHRIASGIWNIRFLNRSTVQPPAPVQITANLAPGPHDAPYFPLPSGRLASAFRREQNLVTGNVQEWDFRVPPGRHRDLVIDLYYDARDDVRLQVNMVTGGRTDPLQLNNAISANLDGATLHVEANPAAPNARRFQLAGQYIIDIDHRVSSQSATRNRIRVTLRKNGIVPVPEGIWQLRINPVNIDAGSNGMAEAFMDEMLYRAYSGTSMAAPHITGLAALMLQQDVNQTHMDLKRRMLETARPAVLGHQNNNKLANSWHPVLGWGQVDAGAALLRHQGGLRHNAGGAPAAVGKVTGCPVNCEDNCLIQPIMVNNQLQNLIVSDRAPYSSSPSAPDADPYEFCSRLSNYSARFRQNAFAGGETASLSTLGSTAIAQPMKRDRNHRGTMNGFEAISWEDAYAQLAERFVEQWSSTGTVVVVEPMSNTGLVKELLFNRFVYHLQALLTANNQVTKCSFTTKKSVQVVGVRTPFGQLFSGAVHPALQQFFNAQPNRLLARCELSLAKNMIVWGANLPANARGFWRSLLAAQASNTEAVNIYVIDPGLRDLPSEVQRIAIAPGTDRYLAQALMLRIVGNSGHATAARQIPPLSMFGDAGRGVQRFLGTQAADFNDFISHIRDVAQNYLSVAAGGEVTVDADLTDLVLPGADAARLTRFQLEFDALARVFHEGPVATVLGSGISRYVPGEEHVQYIAALGFLSSSLGMPGSGIAFGEDMHLQFNDHAFATGHQTQRPEDNASLGSSEQQQSLNLASLAADAPDNTKVCLWFDMDPIVHLPDSHKLRELLGSGGTQLNIQVAYTLDDASRYADIILPLADSLHSWDLFMGSRSPYINLGQGIEAYDENRARPWARVLHELLQSIYHKLKDRFHDDLTPTIDDNIYKTGPLLLPRQRRQELTALMSDGQRIPNILVDQLPRNEVMHMYQQMSDWYSNIHGNQPTVDTEEEINADNWVQFFNRVQVDWILEVLMTAYPERDAIVVLYQLLQQGYAKAPQQFTRDNFVLTPDGATPFCNPVAQGVVFVALQGAAGFATSNSNYVTHFNNLDNSATTGRQAFPMKLVVAQGRDYASHKIPLDIQVNAGVNRRPVVWLNPNSASLAGKNLNDGDTATLSGNLSYVVDQRFEKLIAEVTVKFDDGMALETLWMLPGWDVFNRNGLRTVRAVHTEEGETPAIYDNLVKIENSGYAVPAGAESRGTSPPK